MYITVTVFAVCFLEGNIHSDNDIDDYFSWEKGSGYDVRKND